MAYKQKWFGKPKKFKPLIEDLAFKFLNKKYPIGKMRQSFGRKDTNKAIDSMADVILMCDPDHERANIWVKKKERNRL